MTPDWPTLVFIGVGLVHLLPGLAFVQPQLLTRLYGAGAEGAVLLMLRHRAALLGTVGVVLVAAALIPSWRMPAVVVGGLSMVTYLGLWLGAGPHRQGLQRIALVDAVALPALLAAGWASL